jgi:hypothetical protein
MVVNLQAPDKHAAVRCTQTIDRPEASLLLFRSMVADSKEAPVPASPAGLPAPSNPGTVQVSGMPLAAWKPMLPQSAYPCPCTLDCSSDLHAW